MGLFDSFGFSGNPLNYWAVNQVRKNQLRQNQYTPGVGQLLPSSQGAGMTASPPGTLNGPRDTLLGRMLLNVFTPMALRNMPRTWNGTAAPTITNPGVGATLANPAAPQPVKILPYIPPTIPKIGYRPTGKVSLKGIPIFTRFKS